MFAHAAKLSASVVTRQQEVYDNYSKSDKDERAIFITQQNETLNTGEDPSKAGGLEDEGKFY